MGYSVVLDKAGSFSLSDVDPGERSGLEKKQGEALLEDLGKELRDLQELLYGAGRHALLIVLQGMDASGKDGVIRSVLDYINPQGCHVAPFKVPSPEEAAHDFLWRIHPHAPRRGMIAVFNRSHYEDVVVVRVKELVPEAVWRARYDSINAFEEVIASNETIILKFFLHISRDEQEKRLRAREEAPEKAWKLNPGDWKERQRWDDYQAAYEEALQRCSSPAAPWHIIPSDHKWYRNVAVADAVVGALRPHADSWRAELERRGKEQLALIRQLRKETGVRE